jgi:hypothetical protein
MYCTSNRTYVEAHKNIWEPIILGFQMWDDYVLYYILKYIPTYGRMDLHCITTHQTYTKDKKNPQNGGAGSSRRRVLFSGYFHANAMRIQKPQIAPKMYLSGQNILKHMIIYIYKQEYTL